MTSPEQAIAARLTAIAKRLERHASVYRWMGDVDDLRFLLAHVETLEREQERMTYAHMCRDEHEQIGHNDSENERCPVCRERDRAERAEQARDAAHAALREVRGPECGEDHLVGTEPDQCFACLATLYDALVEAAKAIKSDPHGCPFCDSGKLRNPEKGHRETCGFALLDAALAASAPQKE
jgi:ribosomal protein L37AE/L43A